MMGVFFALPFLTYLQIQPPVAALFLKYTSHGIGLHKRLIFRRPAPFSPFLTPPASAHKDDATEGHCNGFTLGSHGTYFQNREGTKNIQHPYGRYLGHFCLGVIYSKLPDKELKLERRSIDDLDKVKSVITDLIFFIFFAEEKWKIASDKHGSGNTANIGSIKSIADILTGNGVFIKAGEDLFDDYWMNYGKIRDEHGIVDTFARYLKYRNLPSSYNNKK